MARTYVRDNVPLSRFGVLVAQMESIVTSTLQQAPDPLLCFDLLSDLISAIDEEPKESIFLWQRKCEDAIYSLITLGARRPVRHLASVVMTRIISKGDRISVYSRASSLQGFLSGKRSEPQRIAGAAQCLGELYYHFGRKITSGLHETTVIVTKMMKFQEEFVRHEALLMLHNALEGCGGTAAATAYAEAFRLLTRFAISDKSFVVRIAAARCLKSFANIGGPGLGVGELENLSTYCVKAFEDPIPSVRDAFAEALGSLLALGMNPQAQVQPRGKGPSLPAKKLEGCLDRHLVVPFTKAIGPCLKEIRFGIALSWVFFLQALRIKHLQPDTEVQSYASHVMEMIHGDTVVDGHALACVLYILRVGITDQITEPSQRSFLVLMGKLLQSSNASPSMKIAAMRTLSYILQTLGEVPLEFKEDFDDSVVAAFSHFSELVRVEAALTLRALAEVDPSCVGGLFSYTVTTIYALRENVSHGKGSNLKFELDSLHGQTTALAALISISPKLPLGYPSRFPRSVLEVSKKMLTEPSRNLVVASVEKEAGWLLLSSILNSMPKEELEDQVFDILSLWADLFSENPEDFIKQSTALASTLRVWSAAIEALTAFVHCFVSCNVQKDGILVQPVLLYLSRALPYATLLAAHHNQPNLKPSMDIFIIKILRAYQSLQDPQAYKSDHQQIIQLCTIPYRDPSKCEESSCLHLLLDKRDAWLGPWIPGRDWFEDELRYFQGGKDGILPSVCETVVSSFPLPETLQKTLVNQMLLSFGSMFASQDSSGMLSLTAMIEQCQKSGKRQSWHSASLTNICVGLLSGLKSLLALRHHTLGLEILNASQAIFQGILAEGDICASQRRAASEGLGLLARLGNDIFTARMTRTLLAELNGISDSNYAGSLALALGCIHCSAGGMALSTLVPATVSSISFLARTSIHGLQIWALHGLLLTIEAAGLSFVSQVQATLGLAMDILLSEESGWIDLPQGIGRLINAIVAVLGPELAPGSILFSRCKSVIAEISSWQETATLHESVRFTQQLVLFAPQAVSVHSHIETLLSTLSSRQPTLRHLSVLTLRHIIEKDPGSVIHEEIEDNLFQLLDEETDPEIGRLVRATIIRLLFAACPSCPSRWILICRNMVLATSIGRSTGSEMLLEHDNANAPDSNFGEDNEDMVSGQRSKQGLVSHNKDRILRYRTRAFAAECFSLLPEAVGENPAHFDLQLARKSNAYGQRSNDWLVLHLQDLVSLAYQISTIQFENMRAIGVGLLSTILDKFEMIPDPELPGHLLLEQYQAQLVSAVRTALDASAGPALLETGLQLATKIMTSGMISGDQAALKRIFSLISRPLNDLKDLYYPSFAEWVASKIKIRLLAAHASLKCHTFTFLKRHQGDIPDEYEALLPLFSKSSSLLGKYWIQVLKDYSYICLGWNFKEKLISFLDGIQSHATLSKLEPCLEEAWPVILQAVTLDAVPAKPGQSALSSSGLISKYNMVELVPGDYEFLWGFSLFKLFQGQHPISGKRIINLASVKTKYGREANLEECSSIPTLKLYEIVLPAFQSLCAESFFNENFLSMNLCQELLQVFLCYYHLEDKWRCLIVSVIWQIVQNCPRNFLEMDHFFNLLTELSLGYLFNIIQSYNVVPAVDSSSEQLITSISRTVKILMVRLDFQTQKHLKSVLLAFLLAGYKCLRKISTEVSLSSVSDYMRTLHGRLRVYSGDSSDANSGSQLTSFGACLEVIAELSEDCIKSIHLIDPKRLNLQRLLLLKLAFCIEQLFSLVQLAYEAECHEDEKAINPVFFSLLKSCCDTIQIIFTDSNFQVKVTGLQMLKSIIQRSMSTADKRFVIFFVGEQAGNFFKMMQKALEKPITKESVTLFGECLRLLFLLQAQTNVNECQRGFLSIFLEGILMVFSETRGGDSQEVDDIRDTAVRLVTQLAQIPSSAAHFKDFLLSLPATQRQQLQGIIRASVAHNTTMKPSTSISMLDIKLPMPMDERTQHVAPAAATMGKTDELANESAILSTETFYDNDSVEKSEEEEDDWDTFQSFPASNADGSDASIKDKYGPSETSNENSGGQCQPDSSECEDLYVTEKNGIYKSSSIKDQQITEFGERVSSVEVGPSPGSLDTDNALCSPESSEHEIEASATGGSNEAESSGMEINYATEQFSNQSQGDDGNSLPVREGKSLQSGSGGESENEAVKSETMISSCQEGSESSSTSDIHVLFTESKIRAEAEYPIDMRFHDPSANKRDMDGSDDEKKEHESADEDSPGRK